MATWNSDGTTTYVPGESNARAVPPDSKAGNGDEAPHEHAAPPPHPQHVAAPAPKHRA
jgi:hypothetical protein